MENQNPVVRPYMAATDTKTLSGIWLDASLLAHPFIGASRLIEQRQLIEEKYLPNAETWVACHRCEPVGFISVMDTFVGGIFVAPGQQGRGIGRMLITQCGGSKGHAFPGGLYRKRASHAVLHGVRVRGSVAQSHRQ
ncbi:GNAT family N-acetyltransferase [Pararhizobium sp.]|uniref:GNAT family N-acetyltransferase n=1 Tax=Pararhizobium sp. TaxID=1977563 RepID=UPI003D1084BB